MIRTRCAACPHGPDGQPEGCLGQFGGNAYCASVCRGEDHHVLRILAWKPTLPTEAVTTYGEEPSPPPTTPVVEVRPSVAEVREKIARVTRCPHWTKATDCGCAKNYCGLGRGDRGRVDFKDCFACEHLPE